MTSKLEYFLVLCTYVCMPSNVTKPLKDQSYSSWSEGSFLLSPVVMLMYKTGVQNQHTTSGAYKFHIGNALSRVTLVVY